MYQLKYRRQAKNYLARLPFKIKSRIVDKLHEIQENPDDPTLDVDKLKGESGYRLRVGQYRIIYTRHENQLISAHPKIILFQRITLISFQIGNEQFFRGARPHKGFRRGVHRVRRRWKTRGERSSTEKGPFLDGN